MARKCKARLKYGGEDHYHIFLNSVRGISRIIRLAGLMPEDCRIVCSQSEDTRQRNLEKLPPGFSISSTIEPVKLFNYYTSTCFEGQDIFDKNGRIFIVSEKYNDHTKLDIQTSLVQICGRIRDTKYLEINQLYSTSKYNNVSREEFEANLNRDLIIAEKNAKAYDLTVGAERDRLIKDFIPKSPYIGIDGNGRIVLDKNLANLERVHYNTVNGVYKTPFNMVSALKNAGLNVADSTEDDAPDEELEELKSIERTPFKTIFEEYCKLKENKNGYDLSFRESRIALEKPLVVEAYEKLGPARVRELKYHQSNIKREMLKNLHESADTKVFLLLSKRLGVGDKISKAGAKAMLAGIYKELKLKEVAKATDLKR